MDEPSKEVRVRVEAPPSPEPAPLPELQAEERLPKFYYALIFLTLALAGVSLYFCFTA